MAELKSASLKNKDLKKYLEEIQARSDAEERPPPRPEITYALIKKRFQEGRRIPITPGTAKQLSEVDFKRLADDFLQEKDPIEQEKYLRAFRRRKFPFGHEAILKIAQSRNSRKSHRISCACDALSHFQSKEIRTFAIAKLSRTNRPADYLPLLVSNYQEGDEVLLSKIIERSHCKDDVHSLAIGLIQIYRTNRTKECQKPLETAYSKMNCGLHRVDLLEILFENEVLSEKILHEMKFDSFSSVRKMPCF